MKNKRGISVMVGYVLLITLAVVMGGILYAWLSGWIPAEVPECPEATSIVIKDYNCNLTSNRLDLTLSNNGRFDLGGYLIRVTNTSTQEIATINLGPSLIFTGRGIIFENFVLLGDLNDNSFVANDEVQNAFNITRYGNLHKVEITPARWYNQDNKVRFLSCGDVSTLRQDINCT